MSKPTVYQTQKGTRYLKEPGVVLFSRPSVEMNALEGFLADFGFEDYINDPVELPDGTQLCKTLGQLCYFSFGEKRTRNKDADKYFGNVRQSGHGSIVEHANYTFIFYGVSRSLTHELVRHRAGFAFSQVSQRFVSGKLLRFVERPEYQTNDDLHWMFERRIDEAHWHYHYVADELLALQRSGSQILSAEARTDLRKKVNQAARSLLPNETEAPIGVTGNVRAWRHFVEMRASVHAEIEIRRLAVEVFLKLKEAEPILFSDYVVETLDDDTQAVSTTYRKV